MRREKPKVKSISTTMNAFLFLWRKCECCEQQIRLETAWTFGLFNQNECGGGNSRVVGQRVMVCKECCPTMSQADKFAAVFNEGRNALFDSFGLPITATSTPMPECKPPRPPEPPPIRMVNDDFPLSPLDSCR